MKEYDFELNELYEKAVGKLLKINVYDSGEFEKLNEHLKSIINDSVGHPMVPRQILRCIQMTKSCIENKIDHVDGIAPNCVERYDQMMAAIVMNEKTDDRAPGIPRIV